MDTDISEYKHPLGARFDLPIDTSLNQLEKDNRKNGNPAVTRKRITSALEALESDSRNPESMYMQIMKGRSSPESQNSPLRDTTTAAIYWESRELIESLAEAKYRHSRHKSDLLAQDVFQILAEKLSKRNLSDVKHDYCALNYLQYSSIQDMMVQQYLPKLKDRLSKLLDLVENQPATIAANNLETILVAIDNFLLSSPDLQIDPFYQQQTGSVGDFQNLYQSLIAERKPTHQENTDPNDYSTGNFIFSLPGTDEKSKEIVADLKFLLERSSEQQNAFQISELEKAYEKYLCKKPVISGANLKKASDFAESYSKLQNYLTSVASEDDLRIKINTELFRYIDYVFDNLADNLFIALPSTDYTPSTQSTSFIREDLINVHNQFLFKIHDELGALHRSSMVLLFLQKDKWLSYLFNFSAWVKDSYDILHEARQHFHKSHPNVPILDLANLQNAQRFYDSYRKLVPSFIDLKWEFNDLEQEVFSPSTLVTELWQEFRSLFYECRYFLMLEVSPTTDDIINKYKFFYINS